MFAFACALKLRGGVSSAGDVFWGLALGLTAGWATVTEYPSAPAAAMVAALALALVWKDGAPRRWRVVFGIGAGALPCFVALMAYQHAAFGSVFHPSYAYYPQGAFSWMTHGYLGLTYPRIDVALKLLFGCRRGLLFSGPVVLAAPFGLWLLWKQPATHAAAVTAASHRDLLFSLSRFVFFMAGRLVVRSTVHVAGVAVAVPGAGTALGSRCGQSGGSFSGHWPPPASGLHSWPFPSGRNLLTSFIAHCASSIGRRFGQEDFP